MVVAGWALVGRGGRHQWHRSSEAEKSAGKRATRFSQNWPTKTTKNASEWGGEREKEIEENMIMEEKELNGKKKETGRKRQKVE